MSMQSSNSGCEDTEKMLEASLEQARRRKVIHGVCSRYRSKKNLKMSKKLRESNLTWVSTDKNYVQVLGNSFLLDTEKTRSAYCFNHKVASTTWMSLYARLEGDEEFLAEMERTKLYYKVASRMGPKNQFDLLSRLLGDELFLFTVVRNPLDRILSAYRDRVVAECNAAVIDPIMKWLKINQERRDLRFSPTRQSGCYLESTEFLPSFNEFLLYLASDGNHQQNPHWTPYGTNCGPCVVDYDAVIKLETEDKSDQEFVVRRTGMEKFTSLQYMHRTLGGGSTESYRKEYFSKVDCSVLRKVYKIYKIDFELFEYDSDPFFRLCITF